jgi:hypothetical protein
MTPRVELVELDAADKAVTTVRASVSPGNDVSRDLEIVYERPVGASPVARA